MADAPSVAVLAWMAANNAGPTAAAQQFGVPVNRVKQWAYVARHAATVAPPVEQHRLPRMSGAGPVVARVEVVRALLDTCRSDAEAARDAGSWQAVNSFARLERQLWIDLDDATTRATEEAEAAEQAALSARPDAALMGSIIGAIRSMPSDQRDQLMEALAGPAMLRLATSGG